MPDISEIDLNLLKVLQLLAEERSVTRVAERLGRTQSTVSADLKKLRAQFGDPLFVRHARGLQPTARMESLVPHLKVVMHSVDALVAPPIFDPATAQRTFQIVAGDYSEWLIIPRLCSILAAEAPGIRLGFNGCLEGGAILRDSGEGVVVAGNDNLRPQE